MLTENNFRKYLIYAVGEIILVVVGILIALQINNWNDEKKENKALLQNLSIIKSNVKGDLLILDSLKILRKQFIPYYKEEQLTFFDNSFNPQITAKAARCFDAIYFKTNSSGYDALEKATYLSIINGSKVHRLLLEHKKAVEALFTTENETNTTIDDLETHITYATDMNIGYAIASMNEDELKKTNISMAEKLKFLEELHNSVLYRNIIAKASIRDKTVIPRYNELIQISNEVIAEIDKLTKELY